MANARGKSIDNTHLSIDQAETRGFIHRDYIAHCLRWSHVVKRIQHNYAATRILDIGCGKDVPLAKTLYSSRLIVGEYIGLDYNKHDTFDLSAFHTGKFPLSTFGRVDFANDSNVWFDKAANGEPTFEVKGDNGADYFTMPNTLVSFEVMEHIEPAHVRAMLDKARRTMEMARARGDDPVFFLSTPNYDPNVGAAGNHVNEMKHEALGWLIEDIGLKIVNRSGTFASMRDYKHKLFAEHEGAERLFDKLSNYYDVNYLATIFAPLYPALARNCLWELKLWGRKDEAKRLFPTLEYDETKPWTSSEHWRDINPEIGEGRYNG